MRKSIFAAVLAVMATSLIAGCRPDNQGRPDTAMFYERELRKLDKTDLNFEAAPVRDVVAKIADKFGFRVELTRSAVEYIGLNDPRVTARVEAIPANLAFEVVRAELEAKGLILVPENNAFGRPAFKLDRTIAREITSSRPAATDF